MLSVPYHSDYSRLSNSMLSVFRDSPQRYYQQFIAKTLIRDETKALRVGSASHACLFEATVFHEQFCIAPECDRRTNVGKAIYADFLAASDGKTVLARDEMELAMNTATAASLRIMAEGIDLAKGHAEHRIDFTVDIVDCKAKLDWIDPEEGLILDLKTTESTKPEAFASSCAKYGYFRQAGWYLEAARQYYDRDFRMLFVAVDKNAPYDAAIFELDGDDVEAGYRENVAIAHAISSLDSQLPSQWKAAWQTGIKSISQPRYYTPFYELENAE